MNDSTTIVRTNDVTVRITAGKSDRALRTAMILSDVPSPSGPNRFSPIGGIGYRSRSERNPATWPSRLGLAAFGARLGAVGRGSRGSRGGKLSRPRRLRRSERGATPAGPAGLPAAAAGVGPGAAPEPNTSVV